MPPDYLSKSDFKTAFDCGTKLYYRKNQYPSAMDDDEFLRFLADGGFMVEQIAHAAFPNAMDLSGERDQQKARELTDQWLRECDEGALFEGCVMHGNMLARIDILHKKDGVVELIEVKSSSITPNEAEPWKAFCGTKGEIDSRWRPYLLDVTFQLMLARESWKDFKIHAHLWTVDKTQPVNEFETLGNFKLQRNLANPKSRPEVSYAKNRANLRQSKLIARTDVTVLTDRLMDEVRARANELAASLADDNGIQRIKPDIAECYKSCRTCEYRLKNTDSGTRHGFAECWGDLADKKFHILNLYQVSKIGSTSFPDPLSDLIRAGKASYLDLPPDELGKEGPHAKRRRIQWQHSRDRSEWFSEDLRATLLEHQSNPGWPLHFIDFEACNVVLPHHAGMKPYERIAFQWSCHTLHSADRPLEHDEWLNTERDFPNFRFAETLRERIGDKGTVYVWSSFEAVTLAKILEQLALPPETFGTNEITSSREDLAAWIEKLLGPKDDEGKRTNSPRIRDLHKLAERHYFHPDMLGRTSIKVVLPAIWKNQDHIRNHPWFADYQIEKGNPGWDDPYKALPTLPIGTHENETEKDLVSDGTGAIRVYQQLLFAADLKESLRMNHEKLLLQYCKLDTAAMVMIWRHWLGESSKSNTSKSVTPR